MAVGFGTVAIIAVAVAPGILKAISSVASVGRQADYDDDDDDDRDSGGGCGGSSGGAN